MNKKRVLITGASKGIGSQLANIFAQNNYEVIITYNTNYSLACKLKEQIKKKYNNDIFIYKLDITKEDEIENLYNQIEHVDILINNAALSLDSYIEDKTKEEFMKVLEVNVVGPFLLTKKLKDKLSTVINISSLDAEETYNEVSIDYCASKAALNSITKTMALALKNTKIYSIMLPWVNTESVKMADKEYIKSELERTNQKELIEPYQAAKYIYNTLNKDIETGSVIKWSDIDD